VGHVCAAPHADLAILDAPSCRHLAYRPGDQRAERVYSDGELIADNRPQIWEPTHVRGREARNHHHRGTHAKDHRWNSGASARWSECTYRDDSKGNHEYQQ